MSPMTINTHSPIFQMQENEEAIIAEVVERSLEKVLTDFSAEFMLNDAAYKELMRLHKKHPQVSYWQNIYRSLNRSTALPPAWCLR
mgnify:CR=1 FL=1